MTFGLWQWPAILLIGLCAGCSGSSSVGSTSNNPAPPTPGANQPPTASFSATPTTGAAPLRVRVNAFTSTDTDGAVVAYTWNFGDSTAGVDAVTEHTYTQIGNYTVMLTVRDNAGAEATATRQIRVTDATTACAPGAITAACSCGGASRTSGYCCNDTWFDPNYATLTNGCPTAAAFRYVDPAHPSANDANPGTAVAPWATLGRAVWGSQSYNAPHATAALQAGQVAIVRSGTHRSIGKGSRNDPVFNPVNAGTAGAPIVFKAVGNVSIEPQIGYEGMVQSATATSVQFASDADANNDTYAGWSVRIVSGTGAGQLRKIAQTQSPGQQYVTAGSYNGLTRTATLQAAWTTVPDTTSRVTLTRHGTLVGAYNRNHIVWDGFRVIERDSYAPDTGPVVIWGASNVSLLHLEIIGTPLTPQFDNHNGVRIEGSNDSRVSSCDISGFRSTGATLNNFQNEAGMMIYGGQGGVIENNRVHQVHSGIFPKGANGSNLRIRHNIVHDAAQSFRVSYHSNVDIHQNIVYDADMAIRSAEGNSGIRFYNNVTYRTASGPNNWFGSDGIDFFNNVYLDVTRPYDYEGALGNFTSDHNHYYNYTAFRTGNWSDRLGAWQQQMNRDSQSTESDPLFVDPANLDFRLQSGSPLANGGRGGAYPSVRGAYVAGDEVIGPRQ